MVRSRASPEGSPLASRSGVHAQQLAHLLIQEAAARSVRLHPLAVDHELRDRPLAHVTHQLLGGAGYLLDIDFSEFNPVLSEESFRFAAVAAPGGGVHKNLHGAHHTPRIARL